MIRFNMTFKRIALRGRMWQAALACLLACLGADALRVSGQPPGEQEPERTTRPLGDQVSGRDVLHKLAGRWRVDEAYPPSNDLPKGAEGKGTAVFKHALDGVALIGDYKSKCKETGFSVEGHAVFKYDHATRQYRYWWFDNYDRAIDFVGLYNSQSDTLVFTRNVQKPDTESVVAERHSFRFEADDKIVFTWEIATDQDQYDLVLTTTYTTRRSRTTENNQAVPGQ